MKAAAENVSHVASVAPAAAHVAGSRVQFVDLLRFVAAFQMLQGHTIAALLSPAHRTGLVYELWFSARGLTSVAFLFTAGFSFYLATARGYAARHRSQALWSSRMRRVLLLLVLGYALHLPVAAWTSVEPSVRAAALAGFVAVDVLQCIGVSLFVLQALTWLLPTPLALGAVSLAISVAMFALAPLSAGVVPSGPLAPLVAYVSPRAGSLFPLLPWSGHLFFGVSCAAWLGRAARMRVEQRLLLLGLCVVALGLTLRALGTAAPIPDQIGRLGRVLLASAGLAWVAARARSLPSWVYALAGETLFLYAFHVLIVYGAGLGLADQVGARLGPGHALLAAVLVVGLSFAAALGYRRLQTAKAPVP